MTKVPSSSYLILLFYFILTAAACLVIGGIIPMIALLFGIFMSGRSGDVAHLASSGRMITIYYAIIAVICVLVSLGHIAAPLNESIQVMPSYEHEESAIGFGIAAALSISGWSLTRFMLLPAFLPYEEAIATHGFWGRNAKHNKAGDPSIIRTENFRPFSVADELLKWSQLRDSGTVSAEEFEAARRKLLGTSE